MSKSVRQGVGLPQEWIRKKREGQRLSLEEITAFVEGVTSGAVTEAQIAAFSMAVFFQDLDVDERVALTLAVRDSGRVLSWNHDRLHGPILDKHSTGGVGDTVSLMLAPMLAACGAHVPMIAGRGLAHTGGTIDKLEAIPGYQTGVDAAHFQRVVEQHGFAIVRQTDDLAPADRRMYATRDVTATVEHLGLITASIVSKKLAAGLQHLVLDVKCGNGAVMQDAEEARRLAESMVAVGNGAGMKTSALLTDMSVPLAWSAGNALEVQEAVSYLMDPASRHPRLHEVVMALGSTLLVQAGVCPDPSSATTALLSALDSGSALSAWAASIEAMGGDPKVTENPEKVLPQAPVVRPIRAPRSGVLSGYDVRQVGMTVVELGGGRTQPDAPIDPSVGLSQIARAGESKKEGDVLALVHARNDTEAERAGHRFITALKWDQPEDVPHVLQGRIDGSPH
ncbi:MAG TPA: thymidine phosphorylase [Flavobacteriales bacterium]|nr:thymidine phosphorylase [Flavobacteriales bacterium]